MQITKFNEPTYGQPEKQSLIDQFNTYGEKYGGGFDTSPITQGGLGSLSMIDTRNLENFVAPWMAGGQMEAFASPLGGGGVYVPPVEELRENLDPLSDVFTPKKGFEPKSESELQSEAEKKWYNLFGHEIGHLPKGWQYDNPINAMKASWEGRTKSGLDPTDPSHYGGEEIWNHMHDYMYGIGGGADPSYLTGRGLMGLPTPVFGGRFGKRMGYTPGGNWTQKGYDKIRGSGLKDWQQGMLMQGPTTAAGQVALGQRPDQVQAQGQAYMDPDRGNVQAPRMTSSQIRQEADRTGGTRHAGEMTQAAGRVRTQPVRGPHDYKKGGSVDPQEGSATGDLKDWFLNMKGRRPFGRTVRPEPHSKRGDWVDWFLNRRGLAGKFGGSERYKYDSYNPYDYQLFNGGGSVQSGPRTREKLEPRSIDSYRAERSDNIPDPYPLGIELLEKGKNIYNDYKPYIPKVRDDMLNWDLGNWNVGVGEEKFNLGYTLPLGGAGLRQTFRPLKKGLDSLNVTDPSDFYMDKIIRDNPEEVMYNLMRQYPSEEMQEYYDQPVDRYQLDFGGPEIDKWIGENPGSTIGDLYDYLPELRGTGSQPGDFWPGGAEI